MQSCCVSLEAGKLRQDTMIDDTARGAPSPATGTQPVMLMFAGFGDNGSMFDGLLDTPLAASHRLVPLNLPGFGAPPLGVESTLEEMATYVAEAAERSGARIIVAHSVASIIASLATRQPGSPVTTILSLEGNITEEDAYFSGSAADYDGPDAFRTAFLDRLDKMAAENPVIGRYRRAVAEADPLALWQLGRDARRFSAKAVPGEVLMAAARVVYFYNPENCPDRSLDWLRRSAMERVLLDSASHWASVDQPEELALRISEVLPMAAQDKLTDP